MLRFTPARQTASLTGMADVSAACRYAPRLPPTAATDNIRWPAPAFSSMLHAGASGDVFIAARLDFFHENARGMLPAIESLGLGDRVAVHGNSDNGWQGCQAGAKRSSHNFTPPVNGHDFEIEGAAHRLLVGFEVGMEACNTPSIS
jgi:hypothetical protein